MDGYGDLASSNHHHISNHRHINIHIILVIISMDHFCIWLLQAIAHRDLRRPSQPTTIPKELGPKPGIPIAGEFHSLVSLNDHSLALLDSFGIRGLWLPQFYHMMTVDLAVLHSG